MSLIQKRRICRGFTLIELLVVVAIIGILAAILFPVFAQAREKARQTACLSNEKQIGLAVMQYVQDSDERLFVCVKKVGVPASRTGAIAADAASLERARWWNVLMPYIKSGGIFACPSDARPSKSKDADGNPTIARSYLANRAAESLTLAQLDDPAETMVATEKRSDVEDSWIEVFSGDFNYDAATDSMPVASNRHAGGLNCVFFDGHARWYKPAPINASKDLSGCNLVHRYPLVADDMCDLSVAGCANAAPENLCNTFAYSN